MLKLPAAEVIASEINELQMMSARDKMPTSAQVFARVLMRRALQGNQSAMEIVLDRIEGKATKAAANKPSNSHIEDQVEQSLNSLNDFTK